MLNLFRVHTRQGALLLLFFRSSHLEVPFFLVSPFLAHFFVSFAHRKPANDRVDEGGFGAAGSRNPAERSKILWFGLATKEMD